jgi:hypothetical protein
VGPVVPYSGLNSNKVCPASYALLRCRDYYTNDPTVTSSVCGLCWQYTNDPTVLTVSDTMQLDNAVDMYSTALHARTPRTIEHAVDKGIELDNIPEHCMLATSMAGLSTATGTCKHAISRWLSHRYIDINTCERAVYTHVRMPTRTPLRAPCVRPPVNPAAPRCMS